jgi:hypothetical protein
VEWLDTHLTDKVTCAWIEEFDEPRSTITYGIPLKNNNKYLTFASEICLDPVFDDNPVERIPHGTIWEIRKLERRNLNPSEERYYVTHNHNKW